MTPSPPTATSMAAGSNVTPGIGLEELKGLFAQQDQKYQTMLSQVMQHVVAMQSNQVQHYNMAQPAMEVELTEEEINQINQDYQYERWMERQEAQHGAFSSQNNWDLLKPDEEELRRHGDL
jgi:tRNA U34 5-carboxymethylaminomethyl modifying enzyme MnmG/GidA